MKWNQEAEDAVKRVPFFVRKKVRARVEKEARLEGKPVVTLADVKATQKRYLQNMASEVKGYQVDACFGPGGCPNRAVIEENMIEEIETLMQRHDLLAFLKQQVTGDLKFHHEFRITVADCPNACSQPQIKDIGIIGVCRPSVSSEVCSGCEACVEVCREAAISLETGTDGAPVPVLDYERCVACGQCIPVCPTQTLVQEVSGFQVLLGGKLGRHPRLGQALPGIYARAEVLSIINDCVVWFKQTSRGGRRFGEILEPGFVERLAANHKSLWAAG